jgi:hypothetical protein
MLGNKMKSVNNATTALNNPIVKGVKKLKADTVVIGSKTADLITASTKKQLGVASSKKQTLDALQGDGVKSFMLDAPAKGQKPAYPELVNQIRVAIVSAFDGDLQTLLKKEAKTLSDMEKGVKRYWQMQIGSEFAYYRRELRKREDREIAGDKDKSTPVDMYFKDLQSALDRLTKLEGVDFKIVEHKDQIEMLLADK